MSRKPLNETSNMPNPTGAFSGWLSKIVISKITQYIEDGLVRNRRDPISFEGVIQPLSPKLLVIKPEAMRSFEWLQIHSFSGSLNLDTNDIIEVDTGKKYKVMALLDYSRDGFVEYHVVEDFERDASQ